MRPAGTPSSTKGRLDRFRPQAGQFDRPGFGAVGGGGSGEAHTTARVRQGPPRSMPTSSSRTQGRATGHCPDTNATLSRSAPPCSTAPAVRHPARAPWGRSVQPRVQRRSAAAGRPRTQSAPAAVSSAVHCSTSAVREGSSAWGAAVSPSPRKNTRRPQKVRQLTGTRSPSTRSEGRPAACRAGCSPGCPASANRNPRERRCPWAIPEWICRAETSSASSGAAPSDCATVASSLDVSWCRGLHLFLGGASFAAVADEGHRRMRFRRTPVSTTVTSEPEAAANPGSGIGWTPGAGMFDRPRRHHDRPDDLPSTR